MKNLMLAHVENRHEAMFQNATGAVQQQLEVLCEEIRGFFTTRIRELSKRLSRDYLGVIAGVRTLASGVSAQAERELRRAIRLSLVHADQSFAVLFPELSGGHDASEKWKEEEEEPKEEEEEEEEMMDEEEYDYEGEEAMEALEERDSSEESGAEWGVKTEPEIDEEYISC